MFSSECLWYNTLKDTNGQIQEISLPLWQFKGDWSPERHYVAGNLVLLNKIIYRCCEPTEGPEFVSSFWEKLPFHVNESG
ncbi:hypothetical protein P618_200674 [Holospora obtusa F1]|uniref:Uncharacterized protein n=1 Tax=Holospora obtusa F1 TaxID=1399147 RepID=W6TE17_HOLOB|nr:hypothetical protein [Holospora obtusa]ETZ07131.1 hypothetical protein P618_200674 [Holospora obtusa F1]